MNAVRTISIALQAQLDTGQTTLVYCAKATRNDSTVFGYTTETRDLVVDGVTYRASPGFTGSNVSASSDLSVDTLQIEGPNDSTLAYLPITAADLKAGLWDHAALSIFMVNSEDLTQGVIQLVTGTLGEVTMTRGAYRAEFRGMMQRYSRSIGRIYSPGCPWAFGDSNCTKDLTAFTFTGTIEDASDDGMVLIDSARTEPGPGSGVAIVGITQADPAVVETAVPHGFGIDESIVISDVVGMTAANTAQRIVSVPDATHFAIALDTTDFAAYVSDGLATPLVNSGYFTLGKITMTSGLNNGTRDIKAYVEGQIMLQEAFPYTVAPGDTYSIVKGCNKTREMCRDDHDNILNFGGFPDLPGSDKVIQAGRR